MNETNITSNILQKKGHYFEESMNLIDKFVKRKSILVANGDDIKLLKLNMRYNNFERGNKRLVNYINLRKIFTNHIKGKIDITFTGCDTQFDYGIVGKVNNKIVSFERDIMFNSIKTKNKKNFTGFVYSGISIINSALLGNNFKNYNNFEKEFYPRIIKKYKSNYESIKGFWHAIDNIKNINILKKNGNKKKYHEVQKILKKLKLYEKK